MVNQKKDTSKKNKAVKSLCGAVLTVSMLSTGTAFADTLTPTINTENNSKQKIVDYNNTIR